MSIGATPHYGILDLHGRHFVETAKKAGLGPTVIRRVLDEVRTDAAAAAEKARLEIPDAIHNSIAGAIKARLPRLDTADEAL